MPSRTTACRARRRQPGSLRVASSWRPRGRCPVATSAERGPRPQPTRILWWGTSHRMLSRFRPASRHAPRSSSRAAHHRQSGDPDRIPAARRAQRPAHGRPLRASDRHHRAPGISRSWQQNGRRTAQERTRVAPLFGRCDVHRSSTGNESHSPRTPDSPIGVRAGRQVSAGRASGPHCRGHPTAKAGLDNREIRPIRQDQQFWYERTAGPAGIRPHIRNTSACPAPSRPLSPARAYAVVRRTRRRGGAVRGAAVRAGWGRPPRGVACGCCAR